MVHGTRTNRADKGAGLLNLSGDLARHGFAILAFDMRGTGKSPPEPLSLGYFEQRDVLGAVDFLRSGPVPYPALGRTHIIGGWGVSMGAATLLMATAKEPAIRAVVSDCAYADIIPILEREVPRGGHLPPLFTPGGLYRGSCSVWHGLLCCATYRYSCQHSPTSNLFYTWNKRYICSYSQYEYSRCCGSNCA